MTEKLINQLLLTQAVALTPKQLSKTVSLVSIDRTEDGPKSIAVDPDEIGHETPYNFHAIYAADGRESVSVILMLVPVSDRWQLYPATTFVEVQAAAEAAPEVPSTNFPWMQQA